MSCRPTCIYQFFSLSILAILPHFSHLISMYLYFPISKLLTFLSFLHEFLSLSVLTPCQPVGQGVHFLVSKKCFLFISFCRNMDSDSQEATQKVAQMIAMPKTVFSMTVVTYDWSMVGQDPVIRVFGTNPRGQRACCHLHGIYPTIYVRPSDMSMPGWRRVDGK